MCTLRSFDNLDTVCSSATFMTGLNAAYLWNIDSGASDEELEMFHHWKGLSKRWGNDKSDNSHFPGRYSLCKIDSSMKTPRGVSNTVTSRKVPDSRHIHELVPNLRQPLTMTRLHRNDRDAHRMGSFLQGRQRTLGSGGYKGLRHGLWYSNHKFVPKNKDVKYNNIRSTVDSQVGIHSSHYMRHAPASRPCTKLSASTLR